jgi:hypothetical protein
MYLRPIGGMLFPFFSQVTSGLGKPRVSHDNVARESTAAATSVNPSSMVGGTANN